MQVSASASCHNDGLKGCIQQAIVRDIWARSNACWIYGGLGHFQKDCKATLNYQGDDRDDTALSDSNPNNGKMIHTVTTSMPITNLTFKDIWKELVSLVIGNRKTFCPKPQNAPKTTSHCYISGVNPAVMPMVTNVTSTSLPPATSWPTSSATSSGSTSHPTYLGRGPLQSRHQAAVSQGARFKVNRPLTSQGVVQLLDVLDEDTEEMQCKESVEEAGSME